MDAKRRPPPIPEKTVAGMPPAKPPVPGPPPPNQLESQAGRKEVEAEGPARGGQGAPVRVGSSSSKEGAEIRSEGCTNERFDPPVGGQFTSPAVALMDPMKKARRKTAHPPYANQQQQQSGIQRGASPSQGPSLSFGGGGVPVMGGGNKSGTMSASSSNGFHVNSDGTQLHLVQHTAAIQQQTQSQAQKQLRSPSVKRAPGSFVTMQGWLHKQGSDGLMLWKRRWFVLSEFCLFYYKGPDEEKVLGSILLPSYVISPCTSDERKRGGNRKHSFKAEHHNMRTYYFAADTLELMERWIHVMNLASLLQKDFTSGSNAEGVSWDERQSGRPSVSSFSSLLNQSADDSDSGFHGGRSPKHATIAVGAAATPNQALAMNMWNPKVKKLDEETLSEISRERDTAGVCRKGASPEVPPVPGEFQPLYANAPPKPRRLNSSGRDYSTSPERSPERKVNDESVVLRSRVPFNEPVLQNGMYVDRGQRASRPTVAFASIRHERNITYQQQPPSAQPQQLSGNLPPSSQTVFPVVDRRTPDTYGRSNTADGSSTGVAKIVQNRVDYEDVYSVSQNSDALGRLNRWNSGQYDAHHYPGNDIHQNAAQPIPPTHVHHCPSGGHSPQQGHQLHPHSQQQLAVVQRMPIQHPYSVSPTTAQHQHPTPSHLYPNPHQLMPPQPQPQVIQRRTPPLPRPHSADFLGHYEQNQITYVLPLSPNVGSATPSMEQASPKMPSPAIEDAHPKPRPSSQMIEVRERHTVDIYHGQQMPRPKSSMDIRPFNQERTFDPADYWSEESYARMMRQSLYLHSQHVHPSPSSSHKGSETSSGLSVPQQQQSWPSQPQEAIPSIVTQQPQVRPAQVTQTQPTCDALEVWGKGTEDSEVANQNRQSAIVGKRDLHQAGQFLRSASARVPRSRYNSGESPGEPLGAMSAASGEEVRYGERKMQQREESMRRLLEWKQRMLQSPLTRKTSSSSGPRKSVQDSSSHNSSQIASPHYKQMILKQLASQEAAASANNWEHASRRVSSRRGPDDVRTARSRSHDGRRSSASLSRYNSYSSDDDEAMGESRKRVRVRGNQAGKGRRGVGGVGGEDPSATQNPSSTAPTPLHHKTSSPPKSQSQSHNHHHHHPRPTQLEQNGGFQNVHHHHNQMPSDHSGMDHANRPHKVQDNFGNAKSPVPFECEPPPSGAGSDGGGIPPDASYADVESSSHLENWWGVRNGRTLKDEGRSNRSDPQSVAQHDMKRLQLDDDTSKYGRETMSGLSKPLTQSGNDNKNTRDDFTTYSIEFPEIKSNSNNETSNSETTELDHINYMNDIRNQSGLLKQLADQQKGKYLLPNEYSCNEDVPTSKLKSRKTLLDLRSKRENPPKNIVQNRIKAFEPKDDELKDVVKKLPTIPDMKDPIKASHSSYSYNEAQVSSLWGMDNRPNEDAMMHFKKRDNPGNSFVNNNGGAAADVESSDDGTPSSPPPPLPVSPPPALPTNKMAFDPHLISTPTSSSTPKGSNLNTKSVRELLADFERKSEEKKKMLEMENAHNDGNSQLVGEIVDVDVDGDRYYPGRRCVFSDTETLLYETGSDMDEEAEMIRRWKAQKEELALASEHATERRVDKGETVSIPSKEPTEEGDSEVELALRMNGVTISNCSGKVLRNSCSPLTGKNTRMENGNGSMSRVKDISLPPPPTECKILVEADEPMEVITTPGYLRLSLAESLVTHEDLVSPFGSSATTTPPLPNTPTAAEEEQHYMPMTPSRKSILASPSSLQQTGASPTSASHSIIMESVFGSNGTFWTQLEAEEESSYVEMTEEGLVKSLLVSDSLGSSPLAPLSIFASPSGRVGLELCRKSSGESTATYAVPDSPRYSEIPGGTLFDSTMGRNPSAHYELLSRATTLYEPVYMEVRSLKEGGNALEEDTKSRLKKEKEESSEDGKVIKTSEEEQIFRKEKKKKSKNSPPDIDEATNSSKSDNFGDRKMSLPLDPHRMTIGGILPDILNGSSNANNCHILEGIGTDSSDVGDEDEEDADDEASKDLDSLDAPRHPRFSLSDTFRPASYYLGASDRNFSAGGSSKIGLSGGDSGTVGRGLMDMVTGVDPSTNELHGDSSDSDLVSPPPIPTSPPPPLEEDDDDDLAESLEESDDRKSGKTMSLSTQSNTSGTLRNPSPGQRSVISPVSVQPEGSSMSDMSDTASTVCSLRRRPVTGNILDSLINSAPNKSDIPTELYIRRNEMMNEYSDYKRSVDFNSPLSPSLPPELWPRLEDGLPSVSPEALHRRIASADDAAVLYENVPMKIKPKIKSSAMQEAARLPHTPHRSSSPFVQLPENQSPPQPNLAAVKTIIPPNPEQIKNFGSGNMMSPDGETPAGAPYYYSDILRGECEDLGFMSSSSERSVTRNSMHAPATSWRPSRIPLNNQRDDVQETAAKRNDVGRKVNRIQTPGDAFHNVGRHHDTQRVAMADYSRENCEGVDKIMAADLLLIGADKRVDVDERNIYETDTLKKASRKRQSKEQPNWDNAASGPLQPYHQVDPPYHRRCYTPDSLPDSRSSRNIYPYGLVDKSSDGAFLGNPNDLQFSQQNGVGERANRWRRRSRSLEGLLDDDSESPFQQNLVQTPLSSMTTGHIRQAPLTFDNSQGNTWGNPIPATPEVVLDSSPGSRSGINTSSNSNFNGVDPWSEDSLWRESLRRVSLRHTRSLDHLDDCAVPNANQVCPSGRRSVDLLAAGNSEAARKSKVSRGVTYVNDSVALAAERRNRMRPGHKPNQFPPANSGETSGEGVRQGRRGMDGLLGDPRQRGSGGQFDRHSPRQAQEMENSQGAKSLPKDSYDHTGGPRGSRRRGGQVEHTENLPSSEHHFLGEDAPPSPPQSPQPQEPGPGFEIDREKLRQWDLMSSAPLPGMVAGLGGGGGAVTGAPGGKAGAVRRVPAALEGGAEGGGGGAETAGPMGRVLPRADETEARGGDETTARMDGEVPDGQSRKPLQQQELRTSTHQVAGTASGTGSIREPAPTRHSKNDTSTTMLIISQPTPIPIPSPSFVQPPNTRVGPPALKQHGVLPNGVETEMGSGDMDGGGPRRWRGNEGAVVGKAVPMLRWEKDGVAEPMRRHPPEDQPASEGDFLALQRGSRRRLVPPPWICQCIKLWKQNTSPPTKHENTNGGVIRGKKVRDQGEAEQSRDRKKGDRGRGEVSVSAGDLLGRTHEELVLLLIQLRRQSAAVSNAIDLCQADVRAQARLAELEMHRRVEHLKKLEELKKHLLELEKQYEKGKPLINLVDNMVKLGSLYRGNTDAQGQVKSWRSTGGDTMTGPSPAKDRLQFNQRVQEQRLLAEERRDWSRLSPDHGELQAKVQQLYRLDRLLQEESVTIQSLQQDKELLEKALGGLRHKLQGSAVGNSGNLSGTSPRDNHGTKGGANTSVVDPAEAERYRKQQRMLERELSRVRQLLAQNSKKLEETVAENARLEQELVVLRQKLQLSRRTIDTHATSPSPSSSITNAASPSGATASLEAELRRVQSAVGDLQRQRHELSVQVRQLTEKSHSLVEQIRPGPTGVAGAGPIPAKKRHHSTWMVTDLDSMESIDCGIESPGQGLSPSRGLPMMQSLIHSPMESTPLYVNTTLGQHGDREDAGRRAPLEDSQAMANGYELVEAENAEEAQGYQAMDISEADDRMKRFYGIIPREKTEIKTVRIVKRESERRHRDRTSKRVVLVEDPGDSATSPSSTLNRVLEEEVAEGDEGVEEEEEDRGEAEAMATYHHHQQMHHHHHQQPQQQQLAPTTPLASSSVPYSSSFLTSPEDDPILSQFFQRSMSLPRALGKQRSHNQPPPIPPPPPLRVASPRGSSAAVRRQQLMHRRSDAPDRPRSAHEQLFGASSQDEQHCLQQPPLPISFPAYSSYSPSPSSHSASPTLYSPTERFYPPLPPTPDSPPLIAFKSEAAREIAMEMAALHSGEDWANGGRGSVKKRTTPKEKRRHYTVSCSRPLDLESIVIPKMGSARSRDDLDMEQVLRPRLNAPDVVRSTMSHRDFKYNEHTIDSVIGTPNKIVIPERYIPEQAPELSEEEQMHRLKKAEAIRKMLSETTPITAPEVEDNQHKKTSIIKKKVAEEKRQRDHILQLNQILAKQVMEKSKMVAGTTPVAAIGTQD